MKGIKQNVIASAAKQSHLLSITNNAGDCFITSFLAMTKTTNREIRAIQRYFFSCLRNHSIWFLLIALSAAGYIWISYFTIRSNFVQVFSLYFILFVIYLLIVYKVALPGNLKLVLGAALFLRLCLLLATPNLTDDYFRFIWDGLLTAHGYNPYLTTPAAFINGSYSVPGINQALFSALNSQNYYSVYPPLCQLIFGLSAKLCGSNILANVIFMRCLVLLAETGTIIFLYKILKLLQYPERNLLMYAFNPLIIIELSGNLHFEAIMIFFIVLAIYLLLKQRQIASAASFAASIGSKLLPLIFLPLLIRRLGIRKSLVYFGVATITIALFSAPFITIQSVSNFLSGLHLYFQTFEFNASIYYLVRWIGYLVSGYNIIAVAGPVLAIIAFLGIMAIFIFEKNVSWKSLFTSMMFCLTIYIGFSTTVHPWYIATLVMLSVFTGYRYVLLWSLLIILSYSAYQTIPYSENLWLVGTEYLLVFGLMVYELLISFRKINFLRLKPKEG